MGFNHSHAALPNSFKIHSLPYLGNLVSFKKNISRLICATQIFFVVWPSTGGWPTYLRESCRYFSQQLTTANSSMSGGELCAHLPSLCWDLVCLRIASALSLWSQPCEVICATVLLCLEDTLCSWSSNACGLLNSFYPLSSACDLWALGRRCSTVCLFVFIQ